MLAGVDTEVFLDLLGGYNIVEGLFRLFISRGYIVFYKLPILRTRVAVLIYTWVYLTVQSPNTLLTHAGVRGEPLLLYWGLWGVL